MTKLPTYSLHKATGQARVWLNGKSYYLGKYGSAESRVKYGELIQEHASGKLIDPIAPTGGIDPGPTVHTVSAAFLEHADIYYRKNGKRTAEYDCIKSAMRPLTENFGDSPAATMDSVSLRIVRDKMIALGWCRDYVNKAVGRVIRLFRWAASGDGGKLVPASVVTELELLKPLEAGRSKAKEYEPRTAVDPETIELIKSKVDQRAADMIDLCILTGCRGGELVSLTPKMLDQDTFAPVWVAVLADHKMSHKGKSRALVFGPRAIAIMLRYMPDAPSQRFFPIQRKTFSQKIKDACIALGIQPITAHWLRHTNGTNIRREYGLDVAQQVLGHSSARTTERYAGPDLDKAIAAAKDFG